MLDTLAPIIPPAPPVHPKDLSPLRLLLTTIRNSLAIWADYAFDVPFARNKAFGIENVFVNDPSGIHHVMVTHSDNYVRPVIMPRILRSLLGQGLFLAEGNEWRRQRRLVSPAFTPRSIEMMLPHFKLAASDLVAELQGKQAALLSEHYQSAALNAVLRALFTLADQKERNEIGDQVRQFVTGPGRPQILDGFATSESSFAFALRGRRSFQKKWFAAVDTLVARRRSTPHHEDHRDLLDMLMSAHDSDPGLPLGNAEVRDQAATMIFAGYETTARLLFWATYLLSLDLAEQRRVRDELAAFPPDRAMTLADLGNWPRLRLVLLEALRLYPPVPILVREAVADDVIMGEPVKRGVQVYMAPWVLHRHRKHWPHPTAFIPDRFHGQAAPWAAGGAYMPFGAGPRICIGAALAIAEAQIMLANVLHRYAVTMANARPVLPVGRLTIQPSHAPAFAIRTAL